MKIVLFQTIQFSKSSEFSSIWPIDRNLSGATTPGQSRFGSGGNEGILCIPQSSSITGNLPSDCLVSYPGYSLQRSSRYIQQPQPTEQPNFGFIHFASTSPCWISWFPVLLACMILLTSSSQQKLISSDKRRQNDWIIMEAACLIVSDIDFSILYYLEFNRMSFPSKLKKNDNNNDVILLMF